MVAMIDLVACRGSYYCDEGCCAGVQACLEAITKVQRGMSRINIYDIYADVCLPKHNEVTQLASQLSSNGFNLSSTVAAVGAGVRRQALCTP